MGAGWIRLVVAAGVLLAVATVVGAAPEAGGGHLDILTAVHGYDTGGVVVAPLRALTDWLGASIRLDEPRIDVSLGGRTVTLWLGQNRAAANGRVVTLAAGARDYGGIVCAPVRFLCESLGATIRYAALDSDDAAPLDRIPHIIVTAAGRTGRVLVHNAAPGVVTDVVSQLSGSSQTPVGADEAMHLGAYGTDWIIRVGKPHREGFFLASAPAMWTEGEGGPNGDKAGFVSTAMGVYGLKRGEWAFLIGFQDTPGREEWARAGVPENVVRELGLPIR